MDLINVEEAKVYLRLGADAKPLLDLAARTIASRFDALVGYELAHRTYEAVRVSGTGRALLCLRHMHVTEITSVKYLSGRSGAELTWSDLSRDLWELDYENHLGVVGVGGFQFGAGVANWLVNYSAGYTDTTLPGVIRERALYEVERFVKGRMAISAENMGGQSAGGTTYRDISADTVAALRPYMLTSF